MKMNMNSDLTPVPLEAASPVRNIVSNGTRARSALTLMGFITPNSRAPKESNLRDHLFNSVDDFRKNAFIRKCLSRFSSLLYKISRVVWPYMRTMA